MHHFHWINWVIVCGYLATVVGVGFWFLHRNKTAQEYASDISLIIATVVSYWFKA